MKMPQSINPLFFAPCGMNCFVCYKHCNVKTPCAGCLLSDSGKPEHCRNCAIKTCAHGKGLTHCHNCDAFPCKLLKNLEKSYLKRYQTSLIQNGKDVVTLGLSAFMEKQLLKYTCPHCQGVISLHDKVCSHCQSKHSWESL